MKRDIATRGLLAAALAVGAGTLLPAAHATPASKTHHSIAVTGFHSEGDPLGDIRASADALTTVGVDGVNITPDGKHVGRPDRLARKALHVAHHQHLRAEFLVGNFARSDFAERRAHVMLTTPADIAAVSRKLVHSVRSQGWDGVSVDLEALKRRDQHGLVKFLAAIHTALPAGTTLSICISNSVTKPEYHRRGYDLQGIAANVDRIILMAYDEHGSWENHPGPVGDIAWQRRGLTTMEAAGVPGSQIDLGQAGYGYAWRPHQNIYVSDAKARHLVASTGGTSHFDKHIGEWVGHLPDGSTLWWADARSYRIRAHLAIRKGLHGLAVWSLGLSDPIAKF
jgi:spore germination protein YaaH